METKEDNRSLIGIIDNIKLFSDLKPNDKKIELKYKDLLRKIKDRLFELKKRINGQSGSLSRFVSPIKSELCIRRDEYLKMLQIKHSIINRRSVSDDIYLSYLLHSLNVDDLKELCRDNEIKGYSQLNKDGLVEFIIDNLSEEEQREYLIKNEQGIISLEIATALRIINGRSTKEKIQQVRIVNPDKQEIEITFEGFNWEVKTSLTINSENIKDPERSCDCKKGSSGGFCHHFWICFMKALKKGFLSIYHWSLTFLPENFEDYYKGVNL